MPLVGYNEFLNAIKDLNKATQLTLKPILEKLKASAPAASGKDREKSPAPVIKKRDPSPKELAKPVGGSFGKAAAEKKAI